MSKMSLNHVAEGQTVRVDELLAPGSIRRRLLDIGLVEGTNVSCLQKSPAGDPGGVSDPGGGYRHPVGGFLPDRRRRPAKLA